MFGADRSAALLVALSFLAEVFALHVVQNQHRHASDNVVLGNAAYACPLNNDFYYHGVISSPNYPYNYPPSTKCWYYITAEPGQVLSFKFSHYELESCCDYVTIHDGPTEKSPVLAQFGGPGSNTSVPAGVYYTTTRNALVTFQSNPTIQQSGFSFTYNSTTTTSPCNRDILLVINAMADVGSQANFIKELNFIANVLTPTWQVGLNQVRTMLNMQTDDDYAVVWGADDVPNNKLLTETILGLTDYVPNVLENNVTSLNCLMRYANSNLGTFGQKDLDERYGIDKVAIVFVAANANNDQDFYEALEFAHQTRTDEDAKVIIVGMGSGLQQQQISQLAFANGYAFFAGYDQLSSLTNQINNAICKGLNSQCGP